MMEMEITLPQYDVPETYDENRITLLVRDPYCLFAYWELTSQQRAMITAGLGRPWNQVPLVLRVYDLTVPDRDRDEPREYFDLSLPAGTDNYYIYGLLPNHAYGVDLGLMDPHGRFVLLVRSNVVHTPPDTVAGSSDRVTANLQDALLQGLSPDAMGAPNETGRTAAEKIFSSDAVLRNNPTARTNATGPAPDKGEE